MHDLKIMKNCISLEKKVPFLGEFAIIVILSKLCTFKLWCQAFGTKELMTSKIICFSMYRSVPLFHLETEFTRNKLLLSKQI